VNPSSQAATCAEFSGDAMPCTNAFGVRRVVASMGDIDDDGMHGETSVGLGRGMTAMKRPRLTIRRMMVLVAILAGASLAGRSYWDRRLQEYQPLSGSDIRVSVDDAPNFEPGQTVPARIAYNFRLRPGQDPWLGSTVTVVGSVWLEDFETRQYVDGYTFAVPLTRGERESAYGDFVWDALPPRAGLYYVHHWFDYTTPLGELKPGGSGGYWLHRIGPPVPGEEP
jgi:hypothetical protein